MKKFKKILNIVLWIFVAAGITLALGFAEAEQKKVKGKSVSISILNEEENHFIDEDDVKLFLKQRKDTVIGQPITHMNIYELEKSLNAHPVISKADVSVDVNGAVNIDLIQRKPIVRLITTSGESYYIDDEARLMPLSPNYTARVLVANGNIQEKYAQFYKYRIPELQADTVMNRNSVLDDIFEVATCVVKDSLLSQLIQQIYVTDEKEIQLVTAVGGHIILLGEGKEVAEKFNKLKIFYKEGLNSIDNWNKYSIINLKYKDQVICTKK